MQIGIDSFVAALWNPPTQAALNPARYQDSRHSLRTNRPQQMNKS